MRLSISETVYYGCKQVVCYFGNQALRTGYSQVALWGSMKLCNRRLRGVETELQLSCSYITLVRSSYRGEISAYGGSPDR